MGILNEQQKQRAIEVMQEYLAEPESSQAGPSTEVKRRGFPLDQQRVQITETGSAEKTKIQKKK